MEVVAAAVEVLAAVELAAAVVVPPLGPRCGPDLQGQGEGRVTKEFPRLLRQVVVSMSKSVHSAIEIVSETYWAPSSSSETGVCVCVCVQALIRLDPQVADSSLDGAVFHRGCPAFSP